MTTDKTTPRTPYDREIEAAGEAIPSAKNAELRANALVRYHTLQNEQRGYLRALNDTAELRAAAERLAQAAQSAYDMLWSEAHDQRLQLPITRELGEAIDAYRQITGEQA